LRRVPFIGPAAAITNFSQRADASSTPPSELRPVEPAKEAHRVGQRAISRGGSTARTGFDRGTARRCNGRRALNEEILQIAFDRNVKTRCNTGLDEILGAGEPAIEIPLQAFATVAEILSYIYRLSTGCKTGSSRSSCRDHCRCSVTLQPDSFRPDRADAKRSRKGPFLIDHLGRLGTTIEVRVADIVGSLVHVGGQTNSSGKIAA